MPVDSTPLVGNSSNVKGIKPEPAIVPGNAPKTNYHSNNVCTQHQHHCKCIRLNGNSSDDQSIHAFSLSKDNRKTGEVIESPPIELPSKKHLTPTSIAVVNTISSVRSRMLLKILFDPGLTSTLISFKCLPRHCKPCAITNKRQIHTLAGTCSTKQMVVMRKIRLPKFNKNCVVEEQKALVFDGQCKYNVIFGADFLSKTGIDIKYSSGIIEWFDNELPMHDPYHLDNKEYLAMAEILEVQCEVERLFGMDWYNPTCYASEILDAKYGEVSTDDVVNQLTHLNKKQKQDLKVLLKDFTKLFNGTLGVYPNKKFHIDLVPGAQPKYC
jgi:hypothetical protein